MDDCTLVALITSIACSISKCCSEDEIAILAVAFTQLGDTLATIIANRELKEKKNANDFDNINNCNRDINNKDYFKKDEA